MGKRRQTLGLATVALVLAVGAIACGAGRTNASSSTSAGASGSTLLARVHDPRDAPSGHLIDAKRVSERLDGNGRVTFSLAAYRPWRASQLSGCGNARGISFVLPATHRRIWIHGGTRLRARVGDTETHRPIGWASVSRSSGRDVQVTLPAHWLGGDPTQVRWYAQVASGGNRASCSGTFATASVFVDRIPNSGLITPRP